MIDKQKYVDFCIDLFKNKYEKGLTNEKFDSYQSEIESEAKKLGFDMDCFRVDGEFIDEDKNGNLSVIKGEKSFWVEYSFPKGETPHILFTYKWK